MSAFKHDFWTRYAMREIRSSYGIGVDVEGKAKSLNKFGRTLNADNGVKTTVADLIGGDGSAANETFATDNTVDYAVSSSNSDTGVMVVEGHTVDTSTGDMTFVVQNVTLTGQTPAALPTPLFRCTRAYVKNGTYASPASNLAGNVSIYDSAAATGVTLGVPDLVAGVKCLVRGASGINQSEKCATAISKNDFWLVTALRVECQRGNSNTVTVDVDVEFREVGGVWRPLGFEMSLRTASQSAIFATFAPYRIIPRNSDVRMVATSNTNDTAVSGSIDGVLAAVVS